MSENNEDWKFEKGYRTKKRAQSRARRIALLKKIAIFIAIILALALTYFFVDSFVLQNGKAGTNKTATDGNDSTANIKPDKSINAKTADVAIEKSETTDITTFGVIVGGNKGTEESSYHAVVILGGEAAKIVSIPGDLIVETTGGSYEKLKSVAKLFDSSDFPIVIGTIWQGEVKNYLHLPRDFGDLSPGNLAEAFLEAKSSNLSAEQRFNWNKKTKNISASKHYFPTKEIAMGGDKFNQPIESEVNSLFKKLGLNKTTDTDTKTKISIFNGNGVPGIGGKAALKLLKNGFLIEDVKNLKDDQGKDNFNQAETIVYGESRYDKEIDRVIDALESGKKVDKENTYKGVHIIVIIGKDYKQ